MPVMNFLYQSDDNYSKHMGVSILSLLENNKAAADILVIIIDDNISQCTKDAISCIVEEYDRRIQWISADVIRETTVVSEWPKYNSFRKNTNCYLKYFIFDGILDESIERVMYIDSDSVVIGPLDELFSIDMQNMPIGMTRCCLVAESYLESTGIGSNSPYFNAGMNLFDTKKWREGRYSKKLIDNAASRRAFATVDQDLLNIVVGGNVLDLGCRYNFQCMHVAYPHPLYMKHYRPVNYYSSEDVKNASDDPRIMHFLRFLGETPWTKNSIHPCAEIYDKYLSKTPWSNEEKISAKNNGFSFRIGRFLYGILPKSVFLRLFRIMHERMLLTSDRRARRLCDDK